MTGGERAALVARLRAGGCVFAEEEAALLVAEDVPPERLEAMVEARVAGVPLEHVLGWAEFCGLRVPVAPGVFVPRRRSEFLVAQALAFARSESVPAQGGPAYVVVDLCCGAGAIGMAVASALDAFEQRHVELHATDVDPVAVACARGNLEPFGGHVHEGDLYDALPGRLRGRVDLLVVNAPYVPTDEIRLMPPEAREHEATVALDGGPDGVDVHRRIAAHAHEWLAPAGHLLVETSERQASSTADALRLGGLAVRLVSSEDVDAAVVIGTAPSA
jgi:release factor glutamine methyltransferase